MNDKLDKLKSEVKKLSKSKLIDEYINLYLSHDMLQHTQKELYKNFYQKEEENKQLKQQLAEKDIRIEELECQFAYECECNKQLVELQKQLAEKDKEIERLKQQYTILENENGKLTTELIMGKYKKAQKEVSFGKQLAIQELEKVKEEMDLNGNSYCEIRQGTSPHNPTDYAWFNYVKFRNYLNQQIKELKGE